MFLPLDPTEDATAVANKLPQSDLDELVRNCVHAVMVLSQDQNPIKKIDLNKLVFSSTTYRVAGAVAQYANQELNKIFDLRLYETEDKTKLLLVNTNSNAFSSLGHSDSTCDEMGILLLILADIFVSAEERLSDEELENSLKPLEITSEEMKSYIELYLRRMYLIVDRRQETKVYSWGPRAFAEVDPDKFLEFFLKLVNESSDKNWPDLKRRIEKLKSIPNR